MPGNGNGGTAREAVARADGTERLSNFYGPAGLVRRVGAVGLEGELLEDQSPRCTEREHTARDMTCSNVNG